MIWNVLRSLTSLVSGEDSDSDTVSSESESEHEMEESGAGGRDVLNGLTLCGKLVPVEILCSILKWVDEDSLVFSCRLVCKEWQHVIDHLVWEEKVQATKILIGPRSEVQIPWWISYWVLKKKVFCKNIIINNCGEEKLKHWKVRENFGDGWLVEDEPVGTMDPLPRCSEIGDKKSCFVTSFQWSSKEQLIPLAKFGLSSKIMDEIQPDFECSDWIGVRFDCGGKYALQVRLLDSEGRPVGDSLQAEKRLESGDSWAKVSVSLSAPYPPGARYILFVHKGKDTQFWKGHYGIKITGSCVKPIFPKERFLQGRLITSPDQLHLPHLEQQIETQKQQKKS